MALPGVLGLARRERAVSIRGLVATVSDALGRRWSQWRSQSFVPGVVVSSVPLVHRSLPRPRATRRWTDPRHAPPGNFSARAIPDDALDETRVPRHGDSWETVFDFALSYDGHAYWYGLPELVHRVLGGWIRDESLPDDLGELRACLFYEQRRWHHFGDDPAGRSADFMWTLVDAIRSCVEPSHTDPSDGGGEPTRDDSGVYPLSGLRARSARPARVELVLAAQGDHAPSNGSAAWVYDLCRATTADTLAPTLAAARRGAHPSVMAHTLSHAPVIVRVPRPADSGAVAPLRSVHAEVPDARGGAATKFAPDDPRYAGWLRAHHDGFVLNMVGRGAAVHATLHAAGCAAIRPTERFGKAPATRVCAASAAALAAWVSTALRHDPDRCGRCRP